MRKWCAVIAGLCAALAAGIATTIPAAALNTFSPTPQTAWKLNGGAGRAVALSAGVAYIGGDFTSITDGTTTLTRQHVVAVTEADGHAVPSFVADTNGTVYTVAVVGNQLYLGGSFTTVNGQAHKNLARVNLPSGSVDASFKLDADNTVFDLWLQGSRLYVGGDFKVLGSTARTRIAALNTADGTIVGGFAPNVDRRVSSVTAWTGAGGDTVYLGGRLKAVNGQTVLNLAAVNGNTGALLPVRFAGVEAPDPATTTSDILDLDIAPNGGTLFVGIGGQHFNIVGAWDTATGVRNWWHGFDATDHLDGDVQGIVYDDGRLYFGFHGGYNGDNTKRLMVADAACGTLDTGFQPSTNGIAGVVDVAADGGVLAAVGDFTGVSGVTLGGLALFPRTGPPPPPPTTCDPTTTTSSQPTTTASSTTTSSSTTTTPTSTTSSTSSTTTSSTTTSSTTTSSTTTSSTTSTSTVPPGAPCAGTGSPPATWDHVVLIIFENKPLKKIIGNTADAPYLNSLAKACSYASKMTSLSTTSLANYVALTSGYTGHNGGVEVPITSNADPSVWPQDSQSIFGLIDQGNPATSAAAVEWAESMPSNCYLKGSGDFVNNHAPFRYYTATQTTLCPGYSRPFSANPSDQLAARFNLIIPNKVHDMHLVPGTTISQRIKNGDNWAKTYLPALISSPQYQAGHTAIIITWDEGNGTDYTVPFIVITPYTKVGGVSTVAYDHYSTVKGIEQMLGISTLLGHAADAGKTSVRDDAAFHLK